jgi:hypothetical protein
MFPMIKPTLRVEDERDIILEALDKQERSLLRADNTLANHRKAAALRSARLQLSEQTPKIPVRLYCPYAEGVIFPFDECDTAKLA